MSTSTHALRNASLIDGARGPARLVDIGINDGRIDWVMPAGTAPPEVDGIDVAGRTVTPGFIDVHSHADNAPFLAEDDTSKVVQGVTTEVVGNCGFSLAPLSEPHRALFQRYSRRLFPELPWGWSSVAEYFEAADQRGYVTNYVPLVGHHTLRIAALGMAHRDPSVDERAAMGRLVDEAVEAGVFGLSTGLIYPPGVFARPDEISDLVAGLPATAIYATHMRGESSQLMASIHEAIAVARASGRPLQVSHLKVAGRPNWGNMPAALEALDDARAEGLVVTHDVYPYTAGSTMLTATLPPWFQDGGDAEVLRRLEDPESLARLAEDLERDDGTWENQVLGAGWEGIVVASSPSHTHDGKDIATIAEELDVSPLDALVEVLRSESLQVSMVVHSMQEPDLELAMRHPATMIGSDGLPPGTGGKPHPRAYGTFPRVLGRYVRERRTLGLEEAVHKMTGLPARTFGLHDRGVVAEGNVADLVVLEADVVVDTATYERPATPPRGIDLVLQAGQVVVRDGVYQGTRAGRRLVPARHGG